MNTKRFSEVLEVVLTEKEIKEKSEENNKRVLERARLKAEAKRSAEAFTSKIKLADQEIENTARLLEDGKEFRPVECEWFADVEAREMYAVRLDTCETLRRRPMDADERREYLQQKLWEPDSVASAPEVTEKEEDDDLTNEELQAILALAPYEIPIETIETWTGDQRRQAREWAVAAHVQASDNDVDVPPIPEFLWRIREIKEPIEYEDAGGGTPFPTEYSEEEIRRIETYYCGDLIAYGKPVKICYVSEQPHIITGYGQGKIEAWPTLPIENVSEEGVFEYKDAPEPFTYQNMKVNCGSVKRPSWWVIVGPKNTFTVDHSADYPDNEIEARNDDFTAERCDECGRIDGGHADTCSRSGRLTYDDYLRYSEAHNKGNHASHARKMDLRRDPKVDAEVREWKKQMEPKAQAHEATA